MDSHGSEENATVNGLLQTTSKLCSLTYYREHVPCTPVQPILDTGIHYSPDLQLLLCFGCGRVQSSYTWAQHLKRKHRSAYDRLSKRERLSVPQEIGRFALNALDALVVRHNAYYFPGLPVTFHNFKCRECAYVDVNRKNVRNHYRLRHHLPARSGNQKVDYVLEDVPLQVLEGLPHNKKFYFIPKLPVAPEETTSSLYSDVGDPVVTRPRPRLNDVGAAILEAHQKSIEERERQQPFNDSVSNNKKLLNSFLANSNVLGFLHDKDRDVLVDLVSPPSSSTLEVGKDLDLELLETNILTFMLEVHKYIPNLTRRFRQLLKTEDGSKSYKQMKDFIQLNNPEPHFKRYCRLATFIVRVHLIRESYRQEASNAVKSKYFDTTEHIHLGGETAASIKQLIDLGVQSIRDDTDQQYTPAFRRIVSRLFHSLLKDPIHLKVKENATFKNPVIYFYFSSILDAQTKEILDGPMVSKIASILIYDARLLFLAYYHTTEDNQMLGEREMNQMYEEEVRTYLSNDSKNYFEELTQIRAYALHGSKQYKSTVYSIKESPIGTVQFNGIPYPIEHIKNFFASLAVRLQTHLRSKLLHVSNLDSLGIEFNKIEDTPLLNKTGNSIADTPHLERFKFWFLKELLTEGSEYHRSFVKDISNGRIRFKQSGVQRFLADLNIFTELLGNAMNLYSGGPLRGTELSLILYKNTRTKDRSMLYNKEGEMFFITTDYDKSRNITRRDRKSHRYIVPMLSRIIIVFVAVVLPLRDYIYRHHHGDEKFDNPFLLARNHGSVSSYSFSIRLRQETAAHFRQGLSLHAWRKMVNFIIKTKMHATPLDPESSADSSDSDDLVEDKQANRTTRVSYNHYFNAEYLANSTVTPKDLNALREFSIRYFNYFHLLDDFHSGETDRGKASDISCVEQAEMITLDNRGLLQRLRVLYGDPKANFLNNEQKNCVIQVLSGRPYITYSNRTGSGKSLVYLLPAHIKRDHLYIVITPRLALKEDLYRRACDLKLRPSRFEEPVTYHSNLTFCSVEDLDSQGLRTFIERHKSFGREVTIMLDEAHLFLTEVTFRAHLRNLTSILQYKANVVFITATLPWPLLHLLNTKFGIANFNSIVRGSSNRSDISYRRVYFRAKKDLDETLRNTLQSIEREDDDVRNKILIFVTNKRQGEDMAHLLDSQVVYSGKEDLTSLLQRFIESKSWRTLITTSVLEVGIDIRQIKYTISIEPIYSLISVVQSSGRVRQRGVSYIVCQQPTRYSVNEIRKQSRVQREVRDIHDFGEIDKAWYRLLTIEETCLRTPIGQFLDNVPYRCQGHKDDLCSLCLDHDRLTEETQWREEREMRERRGQWLALEERLLGLKEMYCMYCILDPYNTSNSINHSLLECKRATGDEQMSQLRQAVRGELRRQRLPSTGYGCMRCLMPKNICVKQQEANSGLGEGECLMGSFLVDVMATLFQFREVAGGVVPRIPAEEGELSGFVNKTMAPSGVAALKTVRLVESMNQMDVVKVVEALEGGSSSSSSLETDLERSESEVEMELEVPSPVGGWKISEQGGEQGGTKRCASPRLSEVLEGERKKSRQGWMV